MTSWPSHPPPAPQRPPKPWYRNLWTWLIVYGVIAVLGCLGVVFVFIQEISVPLDEGTYVDQKSVNRAVEQPCDDMADAARQIQIFSTPSVGAASLHHFAKVGRGIPVAIDSVDDANGDALRWRDDWTSVLDAVDAYADKLATDGEGTFDTPVDSDGDPVIENMQYASDIGCEVPSIIAALDPRYQFY